MPGRKEFETIVASAPREKLISFEQSITTPLGAGQYEITRFFAPSQKIVKVLAMYFYCLSPASATSGTHNFYMAFDTPVLDMVKGSQVFNGVGLIFNANAWEQASATSPTDQAATVAVINNLQFDETTPVRFTYQNLTDKVQNNQRLLRVWGVAREVG